MDEARSTKIREHFAYMKAKKQYRHQLHDLIDQWKVEIKVKELADQAQQRQQLADEARQEAARMQALLAEKRMASLTEEIKRAELEHKLAQVRLQRAERRSEQLRKREEARAERYAQLLEASRHWIRREEFEAAIDRALDNPEPFGFITNLKVTKGF